MNEIKALLLEGGKRPSRQSREELDAKGIMATSVNDLAVCLSTLERDRNFIVIVDLDLQRTGIEAVQKVHSLYPEIIVIVMASLERLAVVDEALRLGAWDFVIKQPDLSHLHEIPQAISRSMETKRLRAETECYREETQRLQMENQRYIEEQTKARQDIPEAEAARDELLANIAEDLKSPLAAIIGYLEIASAISPEGAESNQILSIQRAEALARRLFDLVTHHTGALDIEAGRLEIQKSLFDANHILELSVQDRKGEAASKNIEIVVEKADNLPPLSIDAAQMERAMGILISNAIALSPLGGTVTVSSRLEGKEIAVAVKDSGAGIFKEEIPLLFDRKKKLRRRGADVSTVGFYLARTIVTMHGGRIDVQSDPLEGTTLTVLLPI